MKCRRAFDTDLTAVVRGEGGDAAFAMHLPTCLDCAAEVRVWEELDAMLRAGAPAAAAHPDPEVLVAFVDAPATCAPGARSEVERHLATCRVCADEVGSLRRFDPGRVAAEPAAVATTAASPSGGSLRRLVCHPAFAYALVALLLVPLVRDQLARVPQATRVVDERRKMAASKPASPMAADEPASAPIPMPPPAAVARLEKKAAPAQAGAQRAPAAGEDLAAGSALESDGAMRQLTEAESGAAQVRDVEGAPSLSDLAGTLRRKSADAAPSAAVIELHAQVPTVVASAVGVGGVVLRIVPPEDLGRGSLDVRVRGRGGGREIATRVVDRADAIAVPIPPHWLVPGDYVVTLSPAETVPGGSAHAVTLGFTVRAPTAAEAGR